MKIGQRDVMAGPLVTVLMSTYNRRRYLPIAIHSVLAQTYRNFEFIIIRDGGQEVRDIVEGFNDDRIRLIDRCENRGKAHSLNQAVQMARGKYICYIDDDDLFYPHHIETLVRAIEADPDRYGLVYSDLYKTHCRVEEDGSRTVLSKNVEVCRDFDRFVLLFYNLALHVSLMHRRDLFEQSGLYNEALPILIDWDLTRKLCFYTDFLHVPEVTGEFFAPVSDCDRISIRQRKNKKEYIYNLLTIRSSRPPKPWPKLEDLSVIVLAPRVDDTLIKTLTDIWSHSFYPHQIYLPLPREELVNLRTMVPNVIGVPVSAGACAGRKVDAVLDVCEGGYVGIAPSGLAIDKDDCMWIERALYPLISCRDNRVAYRIRSNESRQWAAVFRRNQLCDIRRNCPDEDIRRSVELSGTQVLTPTADDLPFELDHVLKGAEELEENGEWLRAAKYFDYMQQTFANTIWMSCRLANALCRGGKYERAIEVAGELNARRPTAASLLIEARAHKGKQDYPSAIRLYRQAEQILQSREQTCTTT